MTGIAYLAYTKHLYLVIISYILVTFKDPSQPRFCFCLRVGNCGEKIRSKVKGGKRRYPMKFWRNISLELSAPVEKGQVKPRKQHTEKNYYIL